MKPLVSLLVWITLLFAATANAACSDNPAFHHHTHYREQPVKYHKQNPVIYCEYLNDDRGKLYSVCRECSGNRCQKEYYYSDSCHC
jgi:hypothetical protein